MHRASFSPFIVCPVPHAVRCLAACLSLAALGVALLPAAQAQAPVPQPEASTTAPATLKSSSMLAEKPPVGPGNEVPTFVFGDRLSGRPDLETVIEGDAELRRGTTSIRADRIEYYQPDDTVKTRGNVRINSAGNQFQGPELQIKLDTFEGFFNEPKFRFLSNGGNGQASRIDFVDDKRLIARNASFTTCERGDEATWNPAWVLTGNVASGAVLTEADAMSSEVDWAAEPAAVVADPALWVGQVAVRSLLAGQALRQSMVRTPHLFKTGAQVRVLAQGPGYAVSASGQAMGAGAVGESVRVRMANGKIVSGLVNEDGTVTGTL